MLEFSQGERDLMRSFLFLSKQKITKQKHKISLSGAKILLANLSRSIYVWRACVLRDKEEERNREAGSSVLCSAGSVHAQTGLPSPIPH